jgi:hypothetical protein
MELDELIAEVEQGSPSDEPLDRLAAAARRHEQLTDQADQMIGHFVEAARDAKCSWAQIGEVLGVTKQAAQQRHGSRWRSLYPTELVRGLRGRHSGLFQRFTDRARASIVEAQGAARAMGHDHVGTGHVLWALLGDHDSIGGRALARWPLGQDDVRGEIEHRLGQGGPAAEAGEPVHIRFDSHAKKALELALREALRLGHDHIGTEHVLLGIVRADDGMAAAILRDQGITANDLRAAVVEEIDALAGPEGPTGEPGAPGAPDEADQPGETDQPRETGAPGEGGG